jgi:hypothetical protein
VPDLKSIPPHSRLSLALRVESHGAATCFGRSVGHFPHSTFALAARLMSAGASVAMLTVMVAASPNLVSHSVDGVELSVTWL